MADAIPSHPFSADRPIDSRAEDLLGRYGFAESLASAIKGWKGRDSLVIALYGPWGSGKSSIKNLCLESLRAAKEDCPQIVEFNPWQWAGQDQLAEAFFREIGLALGRTDKSKIDRLAIENLGEKEKIAIRAFQKTLERKEKGISDDEWLHDKDEDDEDDDV